MDIQDIEVMGYGMKALVLSNLSKAERFPFSWDTTYISEITYCVDFLGNCFLEIVYSVCPSTLWLNCGFRLQEHNGYEPIITIICILRQQIGKNLSSKMYKWPRHYVGVFYCHLMISAILVNLWYSQSVVVWIFNLSWPKPCFWIFKFACNFRISLSSGLKKLLLSLTWLMIIIWLTFEILNRGSYRVI